MFDLSGWIIDRCKEITTELANACFQWLGNMMLLPTGFDNDSILSDLFRTITDISIGFGSCLFAFNLLKLIWQNLGNYQSRSMSEVSVKATIGVIAGSLSPFILNDVLIKISNAIVNMFIAKGVTIGTMQAMIAVTNPTLTMGFFMVALAVTFLILVIQYMIRYAKLIILYCVAPICTMTLMNEDINLFGVWYKDAVTTVFSQSYHMLVLYIIANKIGTISSLNDLLMCLGLMIVMVMPGLFQMGKFIASTGAGRGAAGAGAGMAKMGILKYMGSRIGR